eukprot:TRINITY_DN12005_c0_g1_i1.p2 TRINITY_DN12005_c0_g1~~TRINITY_DN12005_c0_g1_i1.p2  ORF type:complete len:120 (-),score=30.59 TRINITY_DN12005_c0_g1_i1:87-446(-)
MALQYMLVCFISGLPWVQDDTNDYHYATSKAPGFYELQKLKIEHATSNGLGKNLPKELRAFVEHCMQLRFDETPDYEYCERLLLSLLAKQRKMYFERIEEMIDWDQDVIETKGNAEYCM